VLRSGRPHRAPRAGRGARLACGLVLFLFLFLALALFAARPARAQFTNRYPKISGFNHQIYVEGYELPILNAGPADPAVSPDGRAIAVAAGGQLWIIPRATSGALGTARPLTRGRALDSRPAWSADGRRLAAVRDTGTDTQIIQIDVETALATGGGVSVAVDTPAIDLDPAYSRDGRWLYYSSAAAGDLDLWRLELATGRRERLTTDVGLELRPLPLPDGRHVVFLTKQRGGADTVSLLDLAAGKARVLSHQWIASLLRPALSPDGKRLALNLPDAASTADLWRLWVFDLDPLGSADGKQGTLGAQVALGTTVGDATLRPLTPAFSEDGSAVLFAAPDRGHRFHLYRAPLDGRPAEELVPPGWQRPAGATLTIRTLGRAGATPLPARLHIEDAEGHPLLPDSGIVRLDSQSGLTYLYSDGALTLPVPAGMVRVVAARGLATPAVRTEVTLKPGEARTISLTLTPLWSAAAAGYAAGDHHFHPNYGGPYAVGMPELVQALRAEELDVATPMAANLHNRLQDLALWQLQSRAAARPTGRGADSQSRPIIEFAQEVRSHFLGHIGVTFVPTPFWPWYWGPGYPVYDRDDRPNADVLQDTRRRGGIAAYVHPVATREPFAYTEGKGVGAAIPLMLIADAVLGDLDALEVACLWSDEIGTAAIWQRLLTLGIPLALSAGTDAMINVHRNMAVGAARIYVRPRGALTRQSYEDALRAGRSFVTTGPFLELTVDGKQPGEALPPGARTVEFSLRLAAAMPVDRVEVLVNGEVAFRSSQGTLLAAPGQTQLRGRLQLPAGGFVSARAVGEHMQWPGMDSYPFAQTGPVWIGPPGSVDPAAQRAAATELLRALDSAEARLRAAFTPEQAPRLHQRLAAARARLIALAHADSP
jgi:TolB protein